MLENLLTEVGDAMIIDDGSSFKLDYDHFHQLPHGGKKGFWRNWDYALKLAEKSTDDFFMFLPDDVSKVNLERIKEAHERFKHNPYVYNVINDKRKFNWNRIAPKRVDKYTYQIGWVDCGFFCNRAALDRFGYYMDAVPESRFTKDNISSGVGQQMTTRLIEREVPMYRNARSFVYHGNHESKMHKELRAIQPIISL